MLLAFSSRKPQASRLKPLLQCWLPQYNRGMSEKEDFKQASLDYHRISPPGKIKVVATKPMLTQRDLALAYSPGVAYACEAIVADPNQASSLTARGNLVAVITNGTAVLGLGVTDGCQSKPRPNLGIPCRSG